MNKKILKSLVMLFIFTLFFSCVYAQSVEAPKDIRIGLYYGSNAEDILKISSPGGIEFGTMYEGEFSYIDEIGANKELVITRNNKAGAISIEGFGVIGSDKEYPYFKSKENEGKSIIKINGKNYRGNVEIRRFSDSDMTVINHLSMQEYLYGVVPREIGGNSPIEAVKAQAIVARTYATKNYGRRAKWGFDLYPTVDDQAYGGYDWENPNSNNAVDETEGQIVVYNGELIGGYYFSTSGGYTESSENVWGGKLDYLKAVPDYYEPEIEGNTSWEVEYTAKEIKEKLSKYGINVGEILSLEPIEYTDAGRVLKLKVIGTKGEEILTKANTRTYLGLKSQWYTINDIAPQAVKIEEIKLPNNNKVEEKLEIKNELEENVDTDKEEFIEINTDYSSSEDKFVITQEEIADLKPLLKKIITSIIGDRLEKQENLNNNIETKETKYKSGKTNSTFIFRGRGWGHAVGMSQNGAKGMANEGFSCEEIITWYYSGVEIID